VFPRARQSFSPFWRCDARKKVEFLNLICISDLVPLQAMQSYHRSSPDGQFTDRLRSTCKDADQGRIEFCVIYDRTGRGNHRLFPVGSLETPQRRPLVLAFLIRRTTIFFRQLCLKIHRLMQDPTDLQRVGFGDAVEKEMPRLPNPIANPACGRPAEIKMIRSAILGDLWPLSATST
jgi:hypothetical protein